MENSAVVPAVFPTVLGMQSSIELDLTVRRPSRRKDGVDLRVCAPAGSTLGDLLPLLAEVVGAEPTRVSCRGAVVEGDAPVGAPPLVHGATLVLDEPTRAASGSSAPVDLVVVAGPDAGRRHPVAPGGVVVGRSAGIGLSLDDVRLSRRHVRIEPSDSGFRVTDLSSTNGTRCGDTVLGGVAEVDGAGLIAIGSSLLRLVRAGSPTAPTLARGDGRVTVNRSPRTQPPRLSPTVAAPTPPTPPRRGRIPWVAAALPLPFAGALALVFGPQMLAFALLSPLMLIGNVLADRIGGRRDHERELTAYGRGLAERKRELAAVRELEREQRWRDAPDPAAVLDIATGPGTRLWERRRGAADVGRVRVGVGELPSRAGWAPAGGVPVEHPPLRDLPVEVELAKVGGLGIAGPRAEVEGVVRHVLGQVAALHSPRDVRVIVRADGLDDSMSWARWLPHTKAYGDLAACLELLRDVVTTREDERERGQSVTHPHVLVVLPECEADLGAGELVDLLDRGRDLGVWCLVGSRHAGALPASCHAVLGLGQGIGDGSARLDVDGEEPLVSFTPDLVGWWWGERIGRSLACLADASGEGETIPGSVELLDLVPWVDQGGAGVAPAIAQHWRVGDGRPVAHLGRVAGDTWSVDLAADGPHVLVGGTTGSGKSELLRTLVTSLALQCSPEDMTFVLVDYKGGSAFGECAELPHTVGFVTNLDDGLARRALVSLGAEITRREELLAASGARDFDDHARRAGRLPRLVIVVDEFRMLADELPEFVDGIVSLAAVGRSLGVHLVLATQRPAGAVTADIQANVNLRIAMRMRDVADSNDVIAAPDAARIPPELPGRGFARGGDGNLVEFQAARVGTATRTPALRLTVLDETGSPTSHRASRTLDVTARGVTERGVTERGEAGAEGGLAHLVTLIRSAAIADGIPEPHRPWLPPLSDVVSATQVGLAGVGLVDQPSEQRQEVFRHDSGERHWLIAGGPRSGRSTALRTVLASHVAPPGSSVHAYVIDTSGEHADLEALPHVGAVVQAGDVARVRRLLRRLRSAASRPGSSPDPVLLLVDGWERLDGEGDLALGGLRDEVLDLLRSGDSSLRAVVTGDRSVLASRLSSVSSETFLLPLADPSDATYAGLSRRDLPSSRVPGRGLRLGDRREVQFALRDPLVEAGPRSEGADLPFAVPQLPGRVEYAAMGAAAREMPAPTKDLEAPLPLGLSADTGSVAHLDPRHHGRRVLVAGHPRSGRTTTLATIGTSAVLGGRTVAVVEARGGSVAGTIRDAVAARPSRPSWPTDEIVTVDPWDAEPLILAKRRCADLVVLVDDTDRLDGTPVEAVLVEIAALADRDSGLVVAASTIAAATSQFRGLLPAVARGQSGILLGPRTPGDGEAFGIRAPRGLARVPGRALLVAGREHHEIHVAQVTRTEPEEAPDTGGTSGEPEHLRPTSRCA